MVIVRIIINVRVEMIDEIILTHNGKWFLTNKIMKNNT